MSEIQAKSRIPTIASAAIVGLASGILSAITLNPLGEASENFPWWPEELFGFLAVFSLSAGLIFGVFGGVFGRLRLAFSPWAMGAFLLTSFLGMAVAVYAAILTFESNGSPASYVIPYLAASAVGALIMAVPVSLLARLQRPIAVILAATGLTTLWSVGVAGAMALLGTDEAMEVDWLIPLFAGWQAIFLVVIALAACGRDQRPHMPLG